MKNSKAALIHGALAAVVFMGSLAPGGGWVGEAKARVGRPMTPVSVAGVARRSTRRAIRRSTIYVASLPPSCTQVNIDGTVLQQCGGTYYQPHQGQYVVVYVD
jgi:hypothetical protein